MEKSIETIWKEGFLKSDALVAPKLNDLYNQKSRNLTEKIRRMMNINMIAIFIYSVVVMVWWYFMEVPFIGAFIFLTLNVFAIYGVIQMKQIKDIDKNTSSYQYLKSFDAWLKSMLYKNSKIMRFFYPLMFLAAAATIWFGNNNSTVLTEKIAKKYPDMYLIGGIPLYWLLGVILVAVLIGVFAGKIYKWDVNLVYGRVFKKLDEIIADMEELRG